MVFSDQDIVGHDEIRNRIFAEYNRSKLHHAMLFTGQESIGKKLVAYEVAKEILKRTTSQSLGNCPDFHYYDPLNADSQKGESKEIRSMLAKLSLRAFEGGARVTIINNAHLLGRSSANALLKTLEEPNADSFFILITHKKEALLSTIRSRCRVWSFAPLGPTEIQRILQVLGRSDKISDSLLQAGSLAELELLAEFAVEAEDLTEVVKEASRGSLSSWYRFVRAHNGLRDKELTRFCFRFLQLQARIELRKCCRPEDAYFLENLSLMEHYVLQRNLSAQLCLTTIIKAYAEKVPLSASHLEDQLAL